MTKNEFMKELRTYLIYEQAAIRNEILADYETYFAMAAASGLTEEEMIAGLDTPSRIASTLYGRDAAVKPRRIGFHSLPSDLIHGVSHGLERGSKRSVPWAALSFPFSAGDPPSSSAGADCYRPFSYSWPPSPA